MIREVIYKSDLHRMFAERCKAEFSAGSAVQQEYLNAFVDRMQELAVRQQNGQLFGITFGDIQGLSKVTAAIAVSSLSSNGGERAARLFEIYNECKEAHRGAVMPTAKVVGAARS